MENIPNPGFVDEKSPLKQLIINILIILAGGSAVFILILFGGKALFGIDTGGLAGTGDGLMDGAAASLRFLIIAQDLSYFIIPSIIIVFLFEGNKGFEIFSCGKIDLNQIMIVIVLMLITFPVTGLSGELNAKMRLPSFMSGLEEWIRTKEDNADNVFSVISHSESFSGIFINMLIIAVLPAISEELVFRGVLQRNFSDIFRSGGLAVWVTAFIFSVLHFQFYGFLPRFILGLIFGYLFLWSGNLWLSVAAHFLNNAIPVAGLLSGNVGTTSETTTRITMPETIMAGICFILMLGIMCYLRKMLRQVASSVIINSGEEENGLL